MLDLNKYIYYVMDTETTNLDPLKGDIIEISLLRVNDNKQSTWHLKAINENNIETGALRVNGYKLDDILCRTEVGKLKHKNPTDVLLEIENFVYEDNYTSDDRVLIGHNVMFDYIYLKQLYSRNNSDDTFPFGRKLIDTMQLEIFLDLVDKRDDCAYSLAASLKKYGIKNSKAHEAEADTIATKELFLKQIEKCRK